MDVYRGSELEFTAHLGLQTIVSIVVQTTLNSPIPSGRPGDAGAGWQMLPVGVPGAMRRQMFESHAGPFSDGEEPAQWRHVNVETLPGMSRDTAAPIKQLSAPRCRPPVGGRRPRPLRI